MKLLSTILLLCILAPWASAQIPEQEEGVVDAAWVVLNDSVLTASMVNQEAERMAKRDPSMTEDQLIITATLSGVRNMLFGEMFISLGFNDALLAPRLESRIQELILESGSRAGFEASLLRDGYPTIEDFRKDLRRVFVESTVKSVLEGVAPTQSQGMLVLSSPTPGEIRKAYDSDASFRHVEPVLEWAPLKFFNERGKAPAAERAAEVSNRLSAGQMTIEEALAAADNARVQSGIHEGMKPELIDFLEFGKAGDVMPLGGNAGGSAQLVLLIGRTEAQKFTFEEAQLTIINKLTLENRRRAVAEAVAAQYHSSYLWVSPELPGLEDFLGQIYGGEISASTSAEL
ncbi:MAG: hypothetical protein O3A95_06990 [Planctomycetota bacterium]|nr:hypothetical protein [Planctomycetota bacterium]MDA1114029.1 hypothetical protein [Planctomycetota bacterium]